MTTERAKFIHPASTPPTGWMYKEIHEGQVYLFQAPMRLELMSQLRRWYADKGLEWPGDREMGARVEDYICAHCPAGFCKGGSKMPKVRFLSTTQIRDVTRLMLDRAFRGDAKVLVPPEEAERRGLICANCPRNLHGICTSCAGNEFQDILRWLIAGRRETSYDKFLDTCAECGCLLRAKVHVSIDELAKTQQHAYPSNCWLHNTAAHAPAKTDPE